MPLATTTKIAIYETARYLTAPFALLCVFVYVCFYRLWARRSEQPRLVWGPIPIISNKYWSYALKRGGYNSRTLMFSYQATINRQEDFDLNISQLLRLPFGPLSQLYEYAVSPYVAFIYAVGRFDMFHHSFRGGFLGGTPLWRAEASFLRIAGKKTVIIAYGEDAYLYSRLIDPSLRHVLLIYRKQPALDERRIQARVDYWTRRADIVITGFMIDGLGRWDVLAFQPVVIDTELWLPKKFYTSADGANGVVKIIHTPNSRGFKGTEYLQRAVEELRAEGLQIELLLIEGVQNEEVRRLTAEEADILAEQFIATGYAMSGIEGMASGLPVLANLESETYTRLFRRCSYLNECPILSTTPETLKENLRVLVTHPRLREQLGRAGREYVLKYHSEKAAQYMFGAIYDKIWYHKDVDLVDLFHPLKATYYRSQPMVEHPLVENRLPSGYELHAQTFVS